MFFPAAPRLTLATGRDWRTLWPADALLFARARFALAEGLRALAERRGVRRLWIPAYLCAPVPEAARAVGLEPVLYDVDDRLAPRYDTITPARGDAMLAVHYFGLVTPLAPLRAFCAEHAMPLVEDCAHALPSPDGRGAGSAGQVAVFSLRKLGPLPGGGLLVVRDPGLRSRVTSPHPRLRLDRRTSARLAIMCVERLAEAVGWNTLRLKDRLPVLDASHDGPEAAPTSAHPPVDEYAAPPAPAWIIRTLLRRTDWTLVMGRRRAAYRALAAELSAAPDLTVAVPDPTPESVPEAFPVFVAEATALVRALRKGGVEAMAWPGAEQFAFDRRRFPGAAMWLERSLCLPLGSSLPVPRARRLARVVREVSAAVRDEPLRVA